MREARQLAIILEMLNAYDLTVPLSRYLKEYFRNHKNMGSNDRRLFSDAIYNYFRLRHAFPPAEKAMAVAAGGFLCGNKLTPFIQYCMQEVAGLEPDSFSLPVAGKLQLLKKKYPEFDKGNIFPFAEALSKQIDKPSYFQSLLQQPVIWIRPRKIFRSTVLSDLENHAIPFEVHDSGAIAIPNRTSLERLNSFLSGYFEIQDISSQQCLSLIHPSPNQKWWDACAASGGKSLALLDKNPSIKLTVSDIRQSILENLKTRFQKAAITGYELLLADLSQPQKIFPGDRLFDGIIADVPCSGSGTWARTPERMSQFQMKDLDYFSGLQKKIPATCIQYLRPGGTFIYITCSVFKAENENATSYIQEELKLQKLNEQYLQFSDMKGDTMFVAVFVKVA
jgi:16S rRNA (cytosine967-C5)-methyltransferase